MKHNVAALEKSRITTTPVQSDLRTHDRSFISGRIVLLWEDGTRSRSMNALVKNVSRGGVLLQSYRGLPVGSFVRLRSNELFFLSGCVKVQHCERRGLTYQIGLKFYNDLSARF